MMAATQSEILSQIDGPVGHDPSSQTGCGLYTRQNAHASMMAAIPMMYGRKGAQRAIVTAPDTPNNTTAHGPMQHRPMNDANALMPMAPPVVAAAPLWDSGAENFVMVGNQLPDSPSNSSSAYTRYRSTRSRAANYSRESQANERIDG